MNSRVYKVGELKKMIRESANEFKPVIGAGVTKANTSNNEKSYKNAEKAAKDFDGGLKEPKKGKLPEKPDANRTTLDYNPQVQPSKDYLEKVAAQAKGYNSKAEQDNGIEKNAEFDNDGKIMKQFTDAADERNKAKETLAHSGINGQNLPKEKKNTMYESKKPVTKRLSFKHTKFLNESNMLSKIPSEYKVDGQRIIMKDMADNEYVVECIRSEKTGMVEANVISYDNKRIVAEQKDRINALMFDYESPKPFAQRNNQERVDESNAFVDMMATARNLMKD